MTITTTCAGCWNHPATLLASTVNHAPDGRDFVASPRPMCAPCALDEIAGIGGVNTYDARLPYATALQLTPLTSVRLDRQAVAS